MVEASCSSRSTCSEISGMLPRGGTIIGTSSRRTRTRSTAASNACARIREPRRARRDRRRGHARRRREAVSTSSRLPIVGVPKTIDNDLSGTDYTFGFDTAVSICTEAIDRLHTTAESHNRVMVVEVMGRHTGWIAVMSGIAGGADVILIPERPVDIEEVCEEIRPPPLDAARTSRSSSSARAASCPAPRTRARSTSSATSCSRSAASARRSAHQIEERTGFETRVTVLGHVQRGGSPTPRDRVLATRFGLKAAELVDEGKFGRMAALHGDDVVDVSLEEATAELKTRAGRLVRRRPRVLRLDLREREARWRRGGTRKFWRCVVAEHRVEALAARARLERRSSRPGARRPSRRRLRWKSSLVGLKTTKWTPAAAVAPHLVRSLRPGERVVERVEVGAHRDRGALRVDRAVGADELRARGARSSGSPRCARSAPSSGSRAGRRPTVETSSGPCGTVCVPCWTVRFGRNAVVTRSSKSKLRYHASRSSWMCDRCMCVPWRK